MQTEWDVLKPRFYHHGFITGSGLTHFIMDRETSAPIAYRGSRIAAENHAARLNNDFYNASQVFARRQSGFLSAEQRAALGLSPLGRRPRSA